MRRDVVSFVRRSARMNDAQRKAWDAHRDRFVLEVESADTSTSISPDASLDLTQHFGRSGPLIVEIGSGIGDSLVPMAAARPDANVLAFEVFEPGVAQTMARLVRHGVDNVRIVIADGAQGLATLVGDGQLTELWTFFADPWHKSRHHKRRLVSRDLAAIVAAKLAPGGLWRLATDWADYAEWMREALDHAPGLTNVHGGWAPRYGGRPLTKFEKRGMDEGRDIYDLTYARTT